MNFLTFLLIPICFFYAALRAFLLSLTHDEALTYTYFAWLTKSYSELFTYQIPTTNNHLLNSILIKFLTGHFGNSEFVIRIPALLGYLIYLGASYLIAKSFLKNWKLPIGFAVLSLHPLLIDYFTCARGYALGLGWMMLGILGIIQCLQNVSGQGTIRNYTFFCLTTGIAFFLSCLSNLVFLNILVSGFAVLMIGTFGSKQFKKSLISITMIIFTLAATAFIYLEPIKKLQKANEFYYGGSSGFWTDSVRSLIRTTIHEKFSDTGIVFYLLNALIVAVLIASAFQLFKLKSIVTVRSHSLKMTTLYASFWMIILLWLSIEAQHFLFKTVYPLDRGVIFLIPLFSLLLLCLFSEDQPNEKKSYFTPLLGSVICAVLLIHFSTCMNITHFLMNKPDAHTKEMILDLQKLNENRSIPAQSKKFGIHWWFEPAINYYLLKYKIPWFGFVNRDGFDGAFDYYYIRNEDKWVIDKYNLKILKHYKVSDTYLAAPQNT